MENSTCPYCGSEEDPELSGRCFRKYKCDSTQWAGGDGKTAIDQSEDCMRIELDALRSKNRDLQQAYDHVLECEQNRCREVVELQDRISSSPVGFWYKWSKSIGPYTVFREKPSFSIVPTVRVRLVRDDQPGEPNA